MKTGLDHVCLAYITQFGFIKYFSENVETSWFGESHTKLHET